LDDGVKVPARFSAEQEDLVTEALREHASRRLHVKGTAEFHPDGRIKAITAIADLEIRPVGEIAFDPSAKPIWEVIEEIGAAVPAGEWASVPADGAQNLDHYLYGHAKKTS
jgi:D-lyxose ketol-isomerase